MTTCKPESTYVLVQCSDCNAQVTVRARSNHRKRCDDCKHEAQLASVRRWNRRKKGDTSEAVRLRKAGAPRGPRKEPKVDPREYGPEKPLLGMDEREFREWRARRIVHLYQTEPELSVPALEERFGVGSAVISRALEEAGVPLREERDLLPAGPPP